MSEHCNYKRYLNNFFSVQLLADYIIFKKNLYHNLKLNYLTCRFFKIMFDGLYLPNILYKNIKFLSLLEYKRFPIET